MVLSNSAKLQQPVDLPTGYVHKHVMCHICTQSNRFDDVGVDQSACCGSEEIGEPGKKTSEETANLKLPDYDVKEVSDGQWLVTFLLSLVAFSTCLY